jgi:drug/metabolite transporter (DMT)-like permease
MKLQKPHFYAILTVIIWSFAASIMRMMLNNNSVISLNVSYFFGLLSYFFLAINEYGSISKIIEKIKLFDFKYYLFGSFGYFFCYLFMDLTYENFNKNISLTTIMNYTWPLLSFIFITFIVKKSKFNKNTLIEILGLCIAFFGIIYFATEGTLCLSGINNPKAIFFGLMIGISYGAFSAFSFKIGPSEITAFNLISISIGLILNITYSIFFAEFNFKNFVYQDLIWCVIFGVFVDCFGYHFWGKAKSLANQMNINIAPVTSIVFFLPIISLLILAILFQEDSTKKNWFWISFILVFVGSVIVSKSEFLITQIKNLWKLIKS